MKEDEMDVRELGQCLARSPEHPLRDVEPPQLSDPRGDARRDSPAPDADLRDDVVLVDVRKDEVAEDAVDVHGCAPLVPDEPDVPLAPGGCATLGQLDVQVGLVLPPCVSVRIPEAPIALDVPEPRQDHAVEVQLPDAADERRLRILATPSAGASLPLSLPCRS
jgi:hypothetical protein